MSIIEILWYMSIIEIRWYEYYRDPVIDEY